MPLTLGFNVLVEINIIQIYLVYWRPCETSVTLP